MRTTYFYDVIGLDVDSIKATVVADAYLLTGFGHASGVYENDPEQEVSFRRVFVKRADENGVDSGDLKLFYKYGHWLLGSDSPITMFDGSGGVVKPEDISFAAGQNVTGT